MGKKPSERFGKADRDCPCEGCEKVRATCRFCEKCSDCCDCPICHKCGGAQSISGRACSDFVKEVGSECNCELCTGWPTKGCFGTIDQDDGNYCENPQGGCSLMFCNKCWPRHNDIILTRLAQNRRIEMLCKKVRTV